jgi:hypothetical protein
MQVDRKSESSRVHVTKDSNQPIAVALLRRLACALSGKFNLTLSNA